MVDLLIHMPPFRFKIKVRKKLILLSVYTAIISQNMYVWRGTYFVTLKRSNKVLDQNEREFGVSTA